MATGECSALAARTDGRLGLMGSAYGAAYGGARERRAIAFCGLRTSAP